MRMLMKVSIPVESGNRAIKDGSLGTIVQAAMERLKPEAAYFFAEDGRRTSLFVFDAKDASQLPSLAEPFFLGLNASISATPVMNADDLAKGIGAAKAAGIV
jgi:hypothetical protein